jgi:ABC-type xylose transport system, permease component
MVNDPRIIARGRMASLRRRLANGDIGQLPVIIGLIVIWGIFGYASGGTFFKSENMVDLSNQMAATGAIAVGVVFVLLLGEIDLTVSFVSGLAAAVMAIANVNMGISAPVAILLGIITGALIGLLQGFWFARLGIPSFVVTIAGYLAWQGAILWVLGKNGVVNLRDPFILHIADTYFNGLEAYGIGALFVAYFGLTGFWSYMTRKSAGLQSQSLRTLVVGIVVLSVITSVAIYWLTGDRGLPLPLVILVGLIILMDYLLRRTRFGRMVYAVGGNVEAARRAGIPVTRVRIACFVICSTFAAWGGIMAASRSLSVNQNAGQGALLMYAIAAAVIGGTSLYGGRGSAWAALLGVVVIQSIANGMTLISINSDMQFIITGLVLLAAVTIDAFTRRAHGPIVR